MPRLCLSNCHIPCPAPHLWTALLVIFFPSDLTLSPQSHQQPKIIFFPIMSQPNPLDIEKYLSLRDSQEILAPLDSSRIFFLKQRDIHDLVSMHSTLSTTWQSSHSLSHVTLLQLLIGMANLWTEKQKLSEVA